MAGDGSRKKGGLKKKQSPPSSKAQSRIGQAIKGKGNQKIVKNERQTVQANHGRRISNRQTLDIHGREARARPKTSPACTLPIQGTVRSWVRGKRA